MRNRRWAWVSAAAIAGMTPGAASAVSCSVQTSPVMFGTYNPLSTAPATAAGSVDVGCTCQGVLDCVAFNYRIEIAAGQSGSTATRQMKSGSATLNYNLYQDSGYTSVWGRDSSGRSVLYLLSLFGSYQRNVVYAQAPARQTIASGVYVDAPMVTITY